jgi:hypothetical protein
MISWSLSFKSSQELYSWIDKDLLKSISQDPSSQHSLT